MPMRPIDIVLYWRFLLQLCRYLINGSAKSTKSTPELNASDKDKPIYVVGSTLECTSAVLASQIKNFAPSVNLTSKIPSSISLPIAKEWSEALRRRKSKLPDVRSKKQDEFEQDSSKVLIENVVSDNQVTKEVVFDDKIIRDLPVSLQEKRRRRSTVFVPETKIPWIKRLKRFCLDKFSRISEYELWNERLETIEGRCGAGVVSYFVFIRWLLYMNLLILVLNLIFLVLPQVAFEHEPRVYMNLSSINSSNLPDSSTIHEYLRKMRWNLDDQALSEEIIQNYFPSHKVLSIAEMSNASEAMSNDTKLSVKDVIDFCHGVYDMEIERVKHSNFFGKIQNLLQGTGILEPTLLFLGHYQPQDLSFFGATYKMPLAFIWVLFIFFVICLIMMMRYSSTGIQESFLTRHGFESLTNVVFGGWDYCVRSHKAASLQHNSFVIKVKSYLFEDCRKKEVEERSTATWAKLYFMRILVNLVVFLWIAGCYVAIYESAMYQLKKLNTKQLRASGFRTFLIQYLSSLVVLVATFSSPYLFFFLATFEGYYGQKQVNLCFIRNVFVTLSSIIALVSSFHQQITCSPRDACGVGKSASCRTPRCWETYVGQQMYKLSLTQIFVILAVFSFFDIPRDYFVQKYDNKCTRLLHRGMFYLPLEVLAPIYAQTLLWLGILYTPLLPVVSVIKLVLLFYIKMAKVLKYSRPSPEIYRASRINATFMVVLMIAFLAVIITHLYTVVHIRPSLGCGPFRYHDSVIEELKGALKIFPFDVVDFINFVFSGWCFLPASLLMCSVIYYYWRYVHFLQQQEYQLKTELIFLSTDKQFLLRKIEALAKKST